MFTKSFKNKDIATSLLKIVPSLASQENGTQVALAQADLLIAKNDHVFVAYPKSDNPILYVVFENIKLYGKCKYPFWPIIAKFFRGSHRYPEIFFNSLNPKYIGSDMKDFKEMSWEVKCVHPHISNDKPCLGKFEKPWSSLLGSFNYAGWSIVCRKFLNTWNRQSPYWDINRVEGWFQTRLTTEEKESQKWALSYEDKCHIYMTQSSQSNQELALMLMGYNQQKLKNGYISSIELRNERIVVYCGWMHDNIRRYTARRPPFINTPMDELRSKMSNLINMIEHNCQHSGYEADSALVRQLQYLYDSHDRVLNNTRQALTSKMGWDQYQAWVKAFGYRNESQAEADARQSREKRFRDNFKYEADFHLKEEIKKYTEQMVHNWRTHGPRNRFESRWYLTQIFNPVFLQQIMDEAKASSLRYAISQHQNKLRRCQNEFDTVGRDYQQDTLFFKEISI